MSPRAPLLLTLVVIVHYYFLSPSKFPYTGKHPHLVVAVCKMLQTGKLWRTLKPLSHMHQAFAEELVLLSGPGNLLPTGGP